MGMSQELMWVVEIELFVNCNPKLKTYGQEPMGEVRKIYRSEEDNWDTLHKMWLERKHAF